MMSWGGAWRFGGGIAGEKVSVLGLLSGLLVPDAVLLTILQVPVSEYVSGRGVHAA